MLASVELVTRDREILRYRKNGGGILSVFIWAGIIAAAAAAASHFVQSIAASERDRARARASERASRWVGMGRSSLDLDIYTSSMIILMLMLSNVSLVEVFEVRLPRRMSDIVCHPC